MFDALSANPESRLLASLKGPGGIIKGKYKELTSDVIDCYRNTGGFDMIMSGRDKIEKPEDLAACNPRADGSGRPGHRWRRRLNTNAAVLAVTLRAQDCPTCVIGVPKTIDGDMKNEQIETSFGFDTAAKILSERSATSSVTLPPL